jgi:hypothetical protein
MGREAQGAPGVGWSCHPPALAAVVPLPHHQAPCAQVAASNTRARWQLCGSGRSADADRQGAGSERRALQGRMLRPAHVTALTAAALLRDPPHR